MVNGIISADHHLVVEVPASKAAVGDETNNFGADDLPIGATIRLA